MILVDFLIVQSLNRVALSQNCYRRFYDTVSPGD